MICLMLTDPFLLQICAGGRCPLARVYVIYDGRRNTVGERMPVTQLPLNAAGNPHGAQVFAYC
jgi:hypothetical protein